MYRSSQDCEQKEPKIFLVGPVVGLIVKIVAEVIKKAVYEKILSKDGVPLINNRFSCLLLSTRYLEIVGYLNQLRNLEISYPVGQVHNQIKKLNERLNHLIFMLKFSTT